jgi:hypothetical protein
MDLQLTGDEAEEAVRVGIERYRSHRRAGISDVRPDGSKCSETTDIQSAVAECFAAKNFGLPFDKSVRLQGDGGCDFRLSLDVDAVWFGFEKGTTILRSTENRHLIIEKDVPSRWADIYVLVGGSVETEFNLLGWMWHNRLIRCPPQDFGNGPKLAMKASSLMPFDLMDIRRFRREYQEV